jgi:hypothetical protein
MKENDVEMNLIKIYISTYGNVTVSSLYHSCRLINMFLKINNMA